MPETELYINSMNQTGIELKRTNFKQNVWVENWPYAIQQLNIVEIKKISNTQ